METINRIIIEFLNRKGYILIHQDINKNFLFKNKKGFGKDIVINDKTTLNQIKQMFKR